VSAGPPVIVVGAGIAGTACARVLVSGGLPVRVLDRGRRVGGRMALRREQVGGAEHVVDIGASYFTVSDPGFSTVADGWRERGLARPWTDTFLVLPAAGGDARTTSGPERWASPVGLRFLVEDLATDLDVASETDVEQVDAGEEGLAVDGAAAAAVVLAMPQPQAADVLPAPLAERLGLEAGLDWLPTLTVWAGWRRRWWPEFDGAFVEGSRVIDRIADDGRRRGDGAPVLVAHSTAEFAARWIDEPDGGIPGVLAELGRLLGGRTPAGDPVFARARRWSLASPRVPQDRPFALDDELAVGVCGDAWGPKSRVEQAWLSGTALGAALLGRLRGF
jgi:predicted NAD/FAD-dependent oxidoreductase